MWRENFRHSEFRPGQEEAIESINNHLENGSKFVVAEIPTGVGKSDIAVCLAKTFDNGYIATSQNTLIDQYVNDFSDDRDFWYVKGRSNYKCGPYTDCDRGAKNDCQFYKDKEYTSCQYKKNRDLASKKKIALTNLSYFALGVNPTTQYSVWGKRAIAVIDEAHNLPSEILNLTSMVITDKHLAAIFMPKKLKDFFTTGPVNTDSADFWKFFTYLEKYLVMGKINYERSDEASKIAFQKVMEEIDMFMGKIKWFKRSYDEEVEWICDLVQEGKLTKLVLRPLDSGYFAQKMFFEHQAQRYLLQSATIINHSRYASDLGIEDDGYEYVEAESPFKLFKNRPLFCVNSGKMGSSDIDGTLPDLAKDIDRILTRYQGKKGIVHTVNYNKIHAYLKEKFSDNPRCLFLDKGNKAEMIALHSESEDTVMFSPSLTEGFDGKDDLVRFQVICKIPYAGLGDRRIKIKLDRDPSWYRDEALKTLVQMVGRGVRSESDYCDNYILDSGFGYFCKQVNPPKSFLNTVVFSKDIVDKRLLSVKK